MYNVKRMIEVFVEMLHKSVDHTEDWALGRHPRDNGHVTH